MQNLRMRVMNSQDIPAVTVLNSSAYPAVTRLTEEEMTQLFDLCNIRLVATNRDRQITAFLLSLGMDKDYDSENYQWFEKRGVRHQYIDRVVVGSSAKGTGIGRALYESVFEHARQCGANEVTAEVNLRPPNPGSVAFHERLGFRRLAEQDTKGGTITVALLARSVY
ncbi:GNAT family N-acetyltransferase [Demequina sp. TTPB684]|uniref:GNAT family N-acetyltransferase n=1 Tax=unclassified Demequina TaxID=2620311 RepID=UPI001CF1FD75|nr:MULTISPECIES: GNAT family N-acetyltransferase [unclassified Demequina]MCB2413042.1 GNAT family N-acetyltransferase [Demequina sp. TTPB684]UPU89459.1 GNAT family N-acetyltransferase [Demequina sp. TMPB413]